MYNITLHVRALHANSCTNSALAISTGAYPGFLKGGSKV